jgi:hypothetical protein
METMMVATAALTAAACSSKDDRPIDRKWPDKPGGPPSSRSSSNFSSSSGYTVVDPVPVPARCSVVGQKNITANVTGTPRADGKVDLVVEFTAAQPEPIAIKKLQYQYNVVGAPRFETKGTSATVTFAADPATPVHLALALECGSESGPLNLTVDAKMPYSVTIHPY